MKDMDKEDKNPEQYCACIWCGNWISQGVYYKRKERQLEPDVCKDCRDVRKSNGLAKYKRITTNHPQLGSINCYIWDGELNDEWMPIDDEGKLVKPGVRICGFKDCISGEHVIAPKVMQVTDRELILGMHELQQHNRRSKAR
jgi:hypothetical protein